MGKESNSWLDKVMRKASREAILVDVIGVNQVSEPLAMGSKSAAQQTYTYEPAAIFPSKLHRRATCHILALRLQLRAVIERWVLNS